MKACSALVQSPSDRYLQQVLASRAVDAGPYSPVRLVQSTLEPLLLQWGNGFIRNVHPSGSFAKGTGNNIGTDIDIFISIHHTVPETHEAIRASLFSWLINAGFQPRHQNVSIGLKVHGYDVDLVPGRHHPSSYEDHGLYIRRKGTWTKTNVLSHIALIRNSGCSEEIRILKLWRQRYGIEFPSFYLEMVALTALNGRTRGDLANNVWHALWFISTQFATLTIYDPANGENEISADLTRDEKNRIVTAAADARTKTNWAEIV